MFIAGVLAYMLATFNGGYVWHLVLFNDMYLALKTWNRFDDVIVPLGAGAIFLQVREGGGARRVICAKRLTFSLGCEPCAELRTFGSSPVLCFCLTRSWRRKNKKEFMAPALFWTSLHLLLTACVSSQSPEL